MGLQANLSSAKVKEAQGKFVEVFRSFEEQDKLSFTDGCRLVKFGPAKYDDLALALALACWQADKEWLDVATVPTVFDCGWKPGEGVHQDEIRVRE